MLDRQSSNTGIDSPRWCAHCQAWGDHHTDRCRQTTVNSEPMRRCPGCLWRTGPPCNGPVCGRWIAP